MGVKAELTANHLCAYGAQNVTAETRYLTGDEPLSGIVIGAVDSMASRRIIWEAINHPDSNVDLYLDGRIGGLKGQLLTLEPFDPSAAEWYETKYLARRDEDVPEAECGKRAIVTSALQPGLIIAEQIRRYHQGEDMPKQVRFDLELYDFKFYGKVGG